MRNQLQRSPSRLARVGMALSSAGPARPQRTFSPEPRRSKIRQFPWDQRPCKSRLFSRDQFPDRLSTEIYRKQISREIVQWLIQGKSLFRSDLDCIEVLTSTTNSGTVRDGSLSWVKHHKRSGEVDIERRQEEERLLHETGNFATATCTINKQIGYTS